MELNFFNESVPVELSKAQMNSKLQFEGSQAIQSVTVHKEGIKIGDKFMSFIYGALFCIEEQQLHLFKKDKTITFNIVNKDGTKWRQVLRQHMNQRGFHEHYKALKRIGKGNFASVFLVQRLIDGEKFAVKTFSKEAAYSEQNGKQCLIKEIQVLRALNSDNNMKLHEVFESDNSLYLVFELLEGGLLYDRIKSRVKFTPTQIRSMIRGLLQGLQQMHSKRIMHRDLKPQNILFRSFDSFDCVIADYGLAQFADSQHYLFVCCGTPGYVAPEIINIRGKQLHYEPVCDIFSAGVIFHQLLMGCSPFKGTSYDDVLTQNRACSFNLNSEQYTCLHPNTLDLLRKLLCTNPQKRISAEQALHSKFFSEEFVKCEKQNDRLKVQIPFNEIQNKKLTRQKKTSALQLKQAREGNVFTGKTETLGSANRESNKNSIYGLNLLSTVKTSKFAKTYGDKQN